MQEITIKTVGEHMPGKFTRISLNKIKEFIAVPYDIEWYSSQDSKKVFPLFIQELSDLNPSKKIIPGILGRNPFFDHAQIRYFIAYKGAIPVGRIAAFIDHNYNNQHNTQTGWFGLFETIEDKYVCQALLESAVDYLKSYSCKTILGPAKFNASGEVGLLVEGFKNRPYFMEPYNAPYYADLIISYGFKKENDWFSVNTDIASVEKYMEKIQRLQKITSGTRWSISDTNGYITRNIDFSNLKEEIIIIRELYNKIWNEGNHPQQSELTHKEFTNIALGIKAISLEELIFISEKDGSPVGVAVNIPDVNEAIEEYDSKNPGKPSKKLFNIKDLKRDIAIFNLIQKKIRDKDFSGIRMFILGITGESRRSSLDSELYYKTFEVATKMGVTHGSASQLADINYDILNPTLKMGKRYHTWRVYSLSL